MNITTMKQLFRFWIVAALLLVVGCSEEYDDSALVGRVDNLENRVQRLEQLCQQMNTNISSLQTIVTALQNNDYVTGVTPITENGKTIGYTITFAKAQTITIYHGKDGQNGADGQNGTDGKDSDYVPTIGVKQDTDGIYYWTLDGEWLLDDAGNKIKAQGVDGKDGVDGEDGADGKDGVDGEDGADGENGKDGEDGKDGTDGTNGINGADGKDGITPQLKIENDYWYVSYDNGASWTQLGKATGEDGKDGTNGTDGTNGSDGKSFFQDVTQDENNVYFTLSDGTVITVPKGLALSIEFAESDLVVMSPNSTREIAYTVTSATASVKVEVTSSADIKAKVVTDNESGLTGKIHISTGATIDEYSKVIVFVSNGDKVIMRSITFEEAGLVVEENATKQASAEGGEVTLEFLSNVECEVVIPEDAQSWISVVPLTRAMEKQTITLKLEPNEGTTRSAEIVVKSIDGKLSLTYTITQEPNLDYQLALEREALIAIYNALDGDNWMNNENWCSDKPVSEWYGVEVESINGKDFVRGLILWSNNLKGDIPSEIGDLQNLQYVDFSGNTISSLPNTIGNLDHLKVLYLHNTDTKIKLPKEIGEMKSLESISFVSADAIPEQFYNAINIQYIDIYNFQGDISSKIGNLQELKHLRLTGNNQSNCYIPEEIGNCISLETMIITCNLRGEIPQTIGNLKNLKLLDLSGTLHTVSTNQLSGAIPSTIGNCNSLEYVYLENNKLSSTIPESIGSLQLKFIALANNMLTGDVPNSLQNNNVWKYCWGYIMNDNMLNNDNVTIQAPVFEVTSVAGKLVKSSNVYGNNEYTLLYQFYPPPHHDFNKINDVKQLYDNYHEKGLEIIGYIHPHSELSSLQDYIESENLLWENVHPVENNEIVSIPIESYYVAFPFNNVAFTLVDSNGIVVEWSVGNMSPILLFLENVLGNGNVDLYESTDYSQDGVVTTLQTATKGNGIDIVLMGDAYSDRQIADGTYKADMDNLYNNLFTEEPYMSFKDHFNVHYVNVVSKNEGYGTYNETALSGYFGDGTLVGGNDNAVFNYALNAISAEEMDEALLIVAMNSDNYAGTCYMYYPDNSAGYGNGISVSYFPKGGDATTFAQLLHHEACGHGFAKLADEYAYEGMGAAPSDYVSQIQEQQDSWGWWKNVDFTSDPTATRWSHFINDTRYANEGLGAYEGGLTYWTGVWRPTENSIMRYNTGGFNAPSREAIYYRIHKLAYGDSWQYDYEKFVEWDARNRTTASMRAKVYKPANYKPTHPPVIVNKSWKDAK